MLFKNKPREEGPENHLSGDDRYTHLEAGVASGYTFERVVFGRTVRFCHDWQYLV